MLGIRTLIALNALRDKFFDKRTTLARTIMEGSHSFPLLSYP